MIYNISRKFPADTYGRRGQRFKMEEMSLIEVQHLTKTYGRRIAVQDAQFKIRNGQICGLLGPVGAGKTSLMHMMAGCLLPEEGSVWINGYDVCEKPREAKRQVGYLPEQFPLFDDMTVGEFLAFVASAKGVSTELAVRQINEALAFVGLEAPSLKQKLVSTLSEAQRRRVGLAQAILGNPAPDIVLLDEPTAGLDAKQAADVRALIRRLGETKTVVIATHSLTEAKELCQHVVALLQGRIVADGDIHILDACTAPTRRLHMCVRGEEASVCALLRAMEGLRDVVVEGHKDGVLTLSITMDAQDSKDRRDDIFFSMAEHRYAVLSMEMEEPSLEELFLHVAGETPSGSSTQETDGEVKA